MDHDQKKDMNALILEIKAGHTDQFEVIVKQYQQQILIYCYHMLGNIQEAEDAKQDVFIKAYEQLHKYRESISFSGWLYKIAYHHCVNKLRRRKLLHHLHTILLYEKPHHTEDHLNSIDMNFRQDETLIYYEVKGTDPFLATFFLVARG
ncbi:ECF RNA polymerase sigma factor SigW [compost metagenome]